MAFWHKKARNATDLHVAHVGRAAFTAGRGMVFDLTRTPGGELARRYGMWVARCVSLNAQTAAAVPFKLVRIERNNQKAADIIRWGGLRWRRPSHKEMGFLKGRLRVQPSSSVRKAIQGNMDDLIVIDEHPLIDLLNEINPWTDGYAFREARYSDLQIFGRAFNLMVEGTGDVPVELWRMLPQKTMPIKDPVDFVSGFRVGSGADEQLYDPEEVLWYRLYDPEDPWGGVGPLEAWLKTVDAAFHIQDFQNELMRRFGAPDYIITSEAPLSDDQKRAFRRDWMRLFGKMFRRNESIAFLSGRETRLEKLGQTNRELEFQASEEAKRDQIGQAFGVPKALLTTDDVNRSNARETRQQHMETTIWPLIQRVEDVDNAQLVPLFGSGMFIMHENPIPEDETIRIQERQSKLQSGWSANEIRAEEDEEPIEDERGDEHLIAAGLLPISMLGKDLEGEGDATEGEPLPEVDVQPQQVLMGQQITAATAIIQAVVDGKLPIESARGQLIVMFNLTTEQADVMLAGVEDFEPDPPEMPVMPGQPARPQLPQAQEQQEQRDIDVPDWLPLALMTKHLADTSRNGITQMHVQPMFNLSMNQPENRFAFNPNIDVKMPELHPAVVNVENPIQVNLPEFPEPVINVAAPHVDVKVPETQTIVKVDAPIVNVDPPNVEVKPAEVNVHPEIHIEPADVKFEPVINVPEGKRPDVKVNVRPIMDLPNRKISFKRDKKGNIVEAIVEDSD